jgi:hypothetical protein
MHHPSLMWISFAISVAGFVLIGIVALIVLRLQKARR